MPSIVNLDGFKRYAIYYAPEEGSALERFGQSWFGFDAGTGQELMPERHGVPEALHARAIAAPSRYALHATMKAPFRPPPGVSGTMIADALAAFASTQAPVIAPPLKFVQMDAYLALTTGVPELNALERAVVRALDHCRAPLAEIDYAKRPASKLSPRQNQLMMQVGYPYALEEFRFHISLAGPLNGAELAKVEQALHPVLAAEMREPFIIRSLALFGDPGDGGKFRLLSRAPMR